MRAFVPGVPVPQGSKRALIRKGSTQPVVIDSNKAGLHHWRQQVATYLLTAAADAGLVRPWDESVAVRLTFFLRRPMAHYLPVNGRRSEATLRPDAPHWVTSTPDIDKLARAILDAMTDARIVADDARVTKLICEKRYADTAQPHGVEIVVAPWRL